MSVSAWESKSGGSLYLCGQANQQAQCLMENIVSKNKMENDWGRYVIFTPGPVFTHIKAHTHTKNVSCWNGTLDCNSMIIVV